MGINKKTLSERYKSARRYFWMDDPDTEYIGRCDALSLVTQRILSTRPFGLPIRVALILAIIAFAVTMLIGNYVHPEGTLARLIFASGRIFLLGISLASLVSDLYFHFWETERLRHRNFWTKGLRVERVIKIGEIGAIFVIGIFSLFTLVQRTAHFTATTLLLELILTAIIVPIGIISFYGAIKFNRWLKSSPLCPKIKLYEEEVTEPPTL